MSIIRELVNFSIYKAQHLAGRIISISQEGVDIRDPNGKHHFTALPRLPDAETLKALFSESFFPWFHRIDSVLKIDGVGNFSQTLTDTGIVLKPKSTKYCAIEAIMDIKPEDAGLIRSLYGQRGQTMVFTCSTERVANEIAETLCAEINLSGRNACFSRGKKGRQSDAFTQSPLSETDQSGIDMALPPKDHWLVETADLDRQYSGKAPLDGFTSHIMVIHSRSAYRSSRVAEGLLQSGEHPILIVDAFSRKDANITASRLKQVSPEPHPATAKPWEPYLMRSRSRPAKIPTWFTTKEEVVSAFLARKSPRGFVSGNAIFFHGPVAYGLSPSNPVAAFVKSACGDPVLACVRSGNFFGFSTPASSDEGDRVQRLSLQNLDLSECVEIDGLSPQRFSWMMERSKSENSHPFAQINRDGINRQLQLCKETLEREVDEAMESERHTLRKADAFRSIQRLDELRKDIMSVFDIELDAVDSFGDSKSIADHMTYLNKQWKREVAARKNQPKL